MRYLCPDCERLVAPGSTRVEGKRVFLECPKCGAFERVGLDVEEDEASEGGVGSQKSDTKVDRSPAVENDEATESPGNEPACPKCGAPRERDEACSKCGLVFSKWKDNAPSAPPEAAAQLWEQIQERWDDEPLHQKFLRVALESEALNFAARCYRGHDDKIAKEQLARITNIGVQAMQAAEKPGRLNPKVFRTVGWVVFFVLCASLLVAAFSVR